MQITIEISQNHFSLHPSGAIFWEEKAMLLIADVHLGKVSHFRKHGSAIPAHVAYKNLEKLTEIANQFQPKTICFLGDLFHSKLNEEWQDFEKWVEYTKAGVILISGNHDIIPNYLYEDLGIRVYDEWVLDGFHLTHHPSELTGTFNFSGHVHPGIMMKGVGRHFLKFPCFYKTESQLILPAFGNFTGKYILTPTEMDEVFAIVEGEVICVSKK
ncbi:ligase-associated DNA damage response endonuclease PdeM [Aequorivita echinoideorum]|uniref:Ligase-associated DNA damage response endonuclease PdeM n=1 Tax=Aequorivita echinoideorum TaxID=1549647 RepID=A0ABS5S1W5_9FLAO|nr:ligase-associated DNA damage response endonuclease PdeM [Aequorivita echinoideorum]MBT0607208.1 ligase-associated DNA damage response endonuclease PdeM [Aequorivita echinoideorum]